MKETAKLDTLIENVHSMAENQSPAKRLPRFMSTSWIFKTLCVKFFIFLRLDRPYRPKPVLCVLTAGR